MNPTTDTKEGTHRKKRLRVNVVKADVNYALQLSHGTMVNCWT